MKNPLFYLLITLYALTACSNGEDYREPKSAEDREIGGLGIHLVRQLMDEIRYERVEGKNILTLVKKVNSVS